MRICPIVPACVYAAILLCFAAISVPAQDTDSLVTFPDTVSVDSAASAATASDSAAPTTLAIPVAYSAAAVSDTTAPFKRALDFSAWGWLTIGQVVRSQSQIAEGVPLDMDFEGEWLTNFEAGLKVVGKLTPRTRARLHFALSLQYPVMRNQLNLSTAEAVGKKFNAVLLDAAVESQFPLAGGRHLLGIEFGYMPVKYNPEARNLGEYLFRSGTYPAYVLSGFESADKVKATGLHLRHTLPQSRAGSFQQDLYFTTDMDVYPVHDFSLSLLSSYATPRKFLSIGGGVQFAHLITVDDTKTDPYKNEAINNDWRNVMWIDFDSSYNPIDSTLYTFRGTKLAARATLDVKVPIERIAGPTRLGKNDLMLYGEIALLGVENYHGWYEHRRERMPVMFGVNLPTWGLLDIFCIEAEYYDNPYYNSTENIWKRYSAIPYTGGTRILSYEQIVTAGWTPKDDDNWRWSIYASRTIGSLVRLSAIAASDHTLRSPAWTPAGYTRYTEICSRTSDWYFMLRASFYL